MVSILDNNTVDIPCPHCSKKLSERIGKLKTNPKLTCRFCQGVFTVDADQLRATTQKVDKALTDLKRTAGRLFK